MEFFGGGSEDSSNGALNAVNFFIFSLFENIESYQSYCRRVLKLSPILSVIGGFLGRLISLLPIVWMCLI